MDWTIEPWSVAYAAGVIFLAYMVRGIAGFGSGLIAVPLLAFVFPVQIVVPLVVFLDYIGSASQGLRNRQHVAWKEQLPLIPFTLIGVGIGIMLLSTLSSSVLAQGLGGFVIAYAIYALLPMPKFKGSRLFVAPFGFLGGFVGTLFGTGGPFYVIYFGLRHLEKSIQRATFAVNFLVDGTIRLLAYASVGFFAKEVLLALAGGLPVAAAALWIGGRIHTEMSHQTYVKLISVLLLGSGMVLLFKN